MLKADLHIHTLYSMDSVMSLEQIIARCLDSGINCIAIADHGTIAGALKLKEVAPFPIIIAEEILTPFGEIMGMFLSKEIPSKLSVEETIAQIKSQDGLVCIPHPYDRLRPSALKDKVLKTIMPSVDIIEVFNARTLTPRSQTKALQLVREFGKHASAGSDAHTPTEIGNTYIEMPEFNGKEEFLESLAQGNIFGHRSNPMVHFTTTRNKLKNFIS